MALRIYTPFSGFCTGTVCSLFKRGNVDTNVHTKQVTVLHGKCYYKTLMKSEAIEAKIQRFLYCLKVGNTCANGLNP